jgi:ABC-type branched-subunit amino acid transport system ATPase component
MEPHLLLLDEPTSGLAPMVVETLAGLIRDVIASGVSVVWVVEQDPEVALEVVDRACIMAGGELVSDLPKDRLADRQTLEQVLTGGIVP